MLMCPNFRNELTYTCGWYKFAQRTVKRAKAQRPKDAAAHYYSYMHIYAKVVVF